MDGQMLRCREGRQAGRKDRQTRKQIDEWMNGGMEREKEGKSSWFPNNGVRGYCSIMFTTHCLQLTVCTTPLSNDLVTGHCESVDYSRLNKNH